MLEKEPSLLSKLVAAIGSGNIFTPSGSSFPVVDFQQPDVNMEVRNVLNISNRVKCSKMRNVVKMRSKRGGA